MHEILTYHKDRLTISTDRNLLDIDVIHDFLSHSYWSPGVPREIVERAIANSLCFGLFEGTMQIGFARVVTDYARHAYLCDVFVLKRHRGRNLGKWLIECVVECPLIRGIRSITLGTRDAHGLYEQFGFKKTEPTGSQMVRMFDMDWFRPDMIEE